MFAPARTLPETPVQAESRDHLRRVLSELSSGGIVFSTMQKFGRSTELARSSKTATRPGTSSTTWPPRAGTSCRSRFAGGGYLVHLGRSTLAEVVRAGERSNRYYAWATDHHIPHFGHAHGAALAATFDIAYQAAMADDTDHTIVEVLHNSTI